MSIGGMHKVSSTRTTLAIEWGMPLWVESDYSHVQHINPLRTSLDQIKSIRLVGWSVVKLRFHNKMEDDF